MRILPKAVQTLITGTADATKIGQALTASVQPTLNFLNAYFQAAQDGSLRALQKVAFLAGAAITGDVSITNGNFIIFTRSGNGFVIVPTGGSPPFYITNAANTAALFLVDSLGNCTGQGFTSANGFKTVLDVGAVWNSSAAAGASYQTQYCVANGTGNTLGQTPFIYKFSHAGSVVGWSFNNAGPALGNMGLRIYKNGALLNNITVGAGGSNATFWGTIAKGANAFGAGDTLTVVLACTNAGNFQASAQLTLEMTA